MEKDLAALSLNNQEDELEEVQKQIKVLIEGEDLWLVGCFLKVSVIHFPVIRSTLVNLWHPVRGIEILDIGEKRFLFRFFHWMDLDRVLKRASWTFNNHLLVFHRFLKGDVPLKVPLVTIPFWIQVHEVPSGFFS